MDTKQLPQPVVNADSKPYWDAARAGRLVIRKCRDCGEVHFMPRHLCPSCWSDQMDWVDAKGTGTVHSYTVIHRPPLPEFTGPYVLAMIELAEGPRMVSNIVGDDALSVAIGDPVEVTFEDRGDGAMLPQFRRRLAA